LVGRAGLGVVCRSDEGQGTLPAAPTLAAGYRAGIVLVAGRRCSTYQTIGRGEAARAHGGDPQGGGPAQIVGGSGARAGNFSPLPAGEVPGAGRAAIVMAVLSALGSAVPAAGRASG